MQFVDQAHIHVRGGKGGNGAVAFRREKFVPKGGPSGGDGGDGGSVIIQVDSGLSTLLDFRYQREYFAASGEGGANKDMYGRGGGNLVLRVPPGTQVHDEDTGALLADLRTPDETFVVARGGRGGRGNIHFSSSTDRAPRKFEPGLPGEERRLRLDLKVLADVGLLGFPNVGKSSLIARISAARPKIADYPFTTLVPNLGMVRLSDERSFVVADIPGLIEGAHNGTGLGDRFLRHLERTRVLVHLLEVSPVPGRTPLKDFLALNRELVLYDPELAKRPQLVVLNKTDLTDVKGRFAQLAKPFKARGIPLLAISAVTGEGVGALLEQVWKQISAARRADAEGRDGAPSSATDLFRSARDAEAEITASAATTTAKKKPAARSRNAAKPAAKKAAAGARGAGSKNAGKKFKKQAKKKPSARSKRS